jgi:predicted phage terminase large subunit-like protein
MSRQLDPRMLSQLSERDLKLLIWRQKWLNTARPKQLPPDLVDHGNGIDQEWTEWGLLAGRGFGKSLTGAQWLAHAAITDPEALPSYVIAPTLNDVRYTCFEGATGILSLIPKEIVKDYNRSNLIITLDTGAVIRGFSAEEPERLRGPQASRAWCDELAAWSVADETWSMMMFGLRLGKNPKVVWTTTPKPKDIIRTLIKPKPHRHITSGSTYENKANLANSFFDQLAQYEGTQLGRQELLAEIIDAEEGGIINRSWLQLWPAGKPFPKFDWIVLSLDTAMTAASIDKKTQNADPTACQVWGVFWHEDRTQLMMLDCWQDYLGFPDLLARVKKERQVPYGDDQQAPILAPLIGPKRMTGSGRKPDILLIEDKGSGISLRQSLEREGVDVYPYNPGNADKLSRLHMVSHIFAQKRVWLPESEKFPKKPRTWCDPAVTQWCSFRGEKSIAHDDHVDAMTQAVRLCLDKQLLTDIKKSKPEREREDNERAPRYNTRGNPYAQ